MSRLLHGSSLHRLLTSFGPEGTGPGTGGEGSGEGGEGRVTSPLPTFHGLFVSLSVPHSHPTHRSSRSVSLREAGALRCLHSLHSLRPPGARYAVSE